MITIRLAATTLLAATALAATPALASPSADRVSVSVPLHDLDLASPAGQRQLDRRIAAAARDVCRSGLRGLTARRVEAPCIAAALLDVAPRAEQAIALAEGGRRLAGAGLSVGG